MKKQLIGTVAITIMLTGCLSSELPEEDTCPGTLYNTTHDKVGESGLILKPSEFMYIEFERIEEIYQETQECVGVVATGPTVEFISFEHRGLGKVWGVHMAASSSVLVNNDSDEEYLPRDCKTDEETLRHEFVHHLLYVSGKNWRDGQSKMFEKCGQGPSVEN